MIVGQYTRKTDDDLFHFHGIGYWVIVPGSKSVLLGYAESDSVEHSKTEGVWCSLIPNAFEGLL